jgi:predicted amidohydrolase
MDTRITVAAAHLAPVYLDARATARKVCHTIREAAAKGVQLLAFPESFVPGFPLWPAVSAPIHNHALFHAFAASSLRVPGPEVAAVCAAARETGIMVSLGISESTPTSVGCLWNTNLLISADGAIVNHHRKMVPTYFEKLIWANGDGEGLQVVASPIGRIGALICGENTNPLARFTLISQGEQIHVSSYPPTWPTHEPAANERYDLASAIRIRACAHSFEAKAFNIVAASRVDQATLDRLASVGEEAVRVVRDSPQGVSMIVAPSGTCIAECAADEDKLLIETIDLDECVMPKQFHDVVGYYNRFDIFQLDVNRRPTQAITFDGQPTPSRNLSFDVIEAASGTASDNQDTA